MAKLVKVQPRSTSGLFTENEIQVIRMICDQRSNDEMAAKLKRSLRTIEGYRAAILNKMKVKNTAGIVIYAVKSGLYIIK